ncbi:MAG: 2Fe-2S iron-sulfur cluster-binding protein [Gammaproteobacteria bacterium]|nr:2Fe-2S iron-sulfur cluster-binding protein [Gammaproteobacteria bacterium]
MENLLSLSRAAKLVGISRGALQKMVQDGQLTSFEGELRMHDLALAFPEAKLEQHRELERYERIIDQALIRARYRKMQDLITPDLATMTARAAILNKELIATKQRFKQYLNTIEQLQAMLSAPQANHLDPDTAKLLNNWINQASEQEQDTDAALPHLSDKDAYLKMMAAHVRLMPSGHDFFLEGADSILEGALQHGFSLDYGCNSGNCGLCKARLLSGQVKPIKHSDFRLSESEKLDNIILMCCSTPVTDITLEATEAHSSEDIPEQHIDVTIRKIEQQENMLILQTRTPRTQRLRFMAGQMVNVQLDEELRAELHIASCPCDDMNIQFHIPYLQGDPVSEHIHHHLDRTAKLTMQGPFGNFVLTEESMSPLVFIAYDSGFAPIKGLIESALAQELAESIHLYRVSNAGTTHYMSNVCRAWQDALDEFHYTDMEVACGDTKHLDTIIAAHPAIGNYNVYIAGPESWASVARDYFSGPGKQPGQLKIETMRY